jgi:hypothetical protein
MVGKVGVKPAWNDVISNCPELHRRDLEISPTCEVTVRKEDVQPFHISCPNDGYY